MSIKINKNGKEYPLGFVPQSLYDDVEDLKDAVDDLTSKIKLISHAEESDTSISANSVADFDVTSEIPSGYYPISVTLERGTSAINLIGCLGIVNTAASSYTPTWKVKVLNYHTTSANIRPIFRITCVKM
jgi:hypothetical protein